MAESPLALRAFLFIPEPVFVSSVTSLITTLGGNGSVLQSSDSTMLCGAPRVGGGRTRSASHPQPFACTTNLPDGLDAASLRRFLIRVNFDHLAPAQSARLFSSVFGMAPPERLTRLDRLTPADFSRIARRVAVLGETPSEHRLVALLEAEMEARAGKPRGIGFARHG